MKKFILGLFSVLFIFASVKVIAEIMSISRFGGLNTDDDPLVLPEGMTPDSQNVITDEGSGLKPRNGFLSFSTESSRGLWSFYTSDGNKYLITQSSNILKATLGGSNFDIYIGTVDPNVNTSVSALGDKLFYTNTTDGLKRWNTTTVEVVTGSYKAAYCVSHKSRLWLAGVVDDERTIYGSEYTDGENFALAVYPVDTDPFRIQVQGALDDVITGFFATYNDMIIWFKQRSFGAVYGSRRSNFGSREYSNSVGCSYVDSVKNCDGLLRWLGNDRVIYEFNGETYYPINKDIDTLMETVEQGDLNQRSWVQTTAADWNSGTIGVGLDTTTTSGSIGFVLNNATISASGFLSTGTMLNDGNSRNLFVNYSTAMTGAIAAMFIPTCTLPLDKVTMSFAYKSNVVEGYQSWVTLHTGATCPAAVVLDTSTNRIEENTNTTGNLTVMTTNYYFSQSTSTDKRLTQGVTYWFVLHTTVTSPNITVSQTNFAYTGTTQTFTVPVGVSSMSVQLIGASGEDGDIGSGDGGNGAKLFSTMTVVSGEVLYVVVGGNPFNGGGDSIDQAGGVGDCHGGGATDLRRGGNHLSNRVLIAGGGGGAGRPTAVGGNGGFPGASGTNSGGTTTGGYGADISSAGIGGTGDYNGQDGSLGQGGNGAIYTIYLLGGGGGGGYYGGGGGAYCTSCRGGLSEESGGGGGASYSAYGGAIHTNGFNDNVGEASISYIQHAEFYAYEIQTPNLSSTTLLFTSSFTIAGSNYSTGLYDTPFEVFFASAVFTSTWTSKVFDAGTKISEWSTFERTESLNDGTIEYRIFGDTDTTIDINNSTTFIDSQTITDGAIPTIEVNRYITVSAKFQRNLSTYTPTLQDFTVNFNEGSSIQTFAEYVKQRYWLGVAVSSTSNNRVLVYDKNKQWQLYNGINISALTNYSGRYYFGNSNGIFLADEGSDDNGTAISSYYKTKDYLLTNPDTYKQFDYLQLSAINSSSTLSTSFYIDRYTTEYSLDSYNMNTDLGLQNSRLSFAMDEMQQGKIISFKFAVNSLVNWRILNFNLYYQSEVEPED